MLTNQSITNRDFSECQVLTLSKDITFEFDNRKLWFYDADQDPPPVCPSFALGTCVHM